MNNPVEAYKAFRVGLNGEPRTLFHGVQGDTEIPLDTWVEADIKMVRDGVGTRYLSGFHSLLTYEEILRYGKRFKSPYPVARVLVADTWPKEHSRSNVVLSRWLYVPSEAWKEALNEQQR